MPVHTKDSLTLVATGDSIITRRLTPYEGVAPQFDELLSLLRNSDATITNFEMNTPSQEDPPSDVTDISVHLRGPPEVIDDLAELGIDLFSAASNISTHYGVDGMRSTIAELESRDVPFAGLGRTLLDAMEPAYLETQGGRVALVSACSSVVPGSVAGDRTAVQEERPGINPLRTEPIYRLPAEQLADLKDISECLGIEDIKRELLGRDMPYVPYGHDWDQEDFFHFWDMKFEEVDEEGDAGIRYSVDEQDERAVAEWIVEASRNADWTVATLHFHQGIDGRRNTAETPSFVQDFARACIDAGADAFVGTGSHKVGGIEIYDGCPIFYSLGNFIVHLETIPRLAASSFELSRLDDLTKPSTVFDVMFYDEDGNPKNYLANDGFWETIVPVCTFTRDEGLTEITLHPCILQQSEARPARGIPVLASGEKANSILEQLANRSTKYGTDVTWEEGTGYILC